MYQALTVNKLFPGFKQYLQKKIRRSGRAKVFCEKGVFKKACSRFCIRQAFIWFESHVDVSCFIKIQVLVLLISIAYIVLYRLSFHMIVDEILVG